MPKKASTTHPETEAEGTTASDFLDQIDQSEKEKNTKEEVGDGDVPEVSDPTSNTPIPVEASSSQISTSTIEDAVSKPKKAKNKKSKLSLKSKSKSKKGKSQDKTQTKLEIGSDQEGEAVPEESTSKETPKRRSFFNLGKKTTTKTPIKAESGDGAEVEVEAKPKKTVKSKLLTDFFPVRRSDRRSKAELEKMETKQLEEKILSGCEDGLQVVEIEGKGRGVIATKKFKRGDFIVEYAGDLITLTEAQAKEDNYSQNPDIGCYMYYFKFQNKNYCVDATAESGKLGRLLNHSKNGNCKTKVVGIGNEPYLILVAAKDIVKNEELLYDYGDRSKEALEAHPWLAY